MRYDAKQLGIDVRYKSGNEQIVICPFHDDKSPSAWFSTEKGLFYCSVCSVGLNFNQLADKLEIENFNVVRGEPEKYDMFPVEREPPRGIKKYNDYLKDRGITKDYFLRNMETTIGGDVIFTQYFGNKREGSIIRKRRGTPKYLNFSNLPVWPFKKVETKSGMKIILVEGLFSAALINQKIEQLCLENIVCFSLLGVNFNSIKSIFVDENCFVYFDNDKAGKNAMEKYKNMFPHHRTKILRVSPDDMNEEDLEKFLYKVKRY